MKYPAILSLLVIGVVSCHSDRPLHPRFSADLSDANHGTNTNQFFFWLPPIVNQSAPASQVFSQQLSPLVLITDEGPATSPLAVCNVPGTVIRMFSGSDVTVSDAAYHVNWHTGQDNLNPDCNYRITVKTAGTVLGFADVDVASGGNQLKNVNTDQDIPLLDDRTLPIKFFIGVGSQCTAGVADCGEGTARPGQNTAIVTTSGPVGIFCPNGAVTEETTISIQSVDNFDAQCIPTLLQQFPGTPGNCCSKVGMHCASKLSTDWMLIVVSSVTAPFGTNIPARPLVVTIVVFWPGRAVPSPQSATPAVHCDPTPMKNLIGNVRSSSRGIS